MKRLAVEERMVLEVTEVRDSEALKPHCAANQKGKHHSAARTVGASTRAVSRP